MRETGYGAWREQRGLAKSSVGTFVSDAKRVEHHYGDLDELFAKDQLDWVLREPRYEAPDRRELRVCSG